MSREYPEIRSLQDIWLKFDLGGYECQRYSIKYNKVVIATDTTALWQDLRSIGLTLEDFKKQLTLF